MPNIAAILRDEICRLAKREIKRYTAATKQAVIQYRRDIADLKRQLREQAKAIAFLKAQDQKAFGQPHPRRKTPWRSVRSLTPLREGPTAPFATLRRGVREVGGCVRADDLPLGARPGAAAKERLAALVAIRGLGRREALGKLSLLAADAKKNHRPARKPR